MSRVTNSWRDTRRSRRKGSNVPARAARWLFSAAVLFAIGFYVWLVIRPTFPDRIPQARILSIVVQSERGHGLEPLDFADAEADLLPPALTRTKTDSHAASLRNLRDDLDAFALTPDDALLVYVRGQGFADGEGAFLACSDFNALSSPQTGRLDLAVLLDSVRQASAGTRLLLLDYGQICSSPLLGMEENDFPNVLERQMRSFPEDERFFVVLSHGTLQISQTDLQQRTPLFLAAIHSVFAHPAQADLDGSGGIGLAEFYQCLTSYCEARISDENCRQTPLLYQSGQGAVTRSAVSTDPQLFTVDSLLALLPAVESDDESAHPPGKELARTPPFRSSRGVISPALAALGPPPPVRTISDGPSGEGDTNREREAGAEGKADTPGDSVPENDAKEKQEGSAQPQPPPAPDAAAPPEAEPAGAQERMWYQLKRAWTSLDALKSRDSRAGVTPVDFAPHLLHAVERNLVDLERGLWATRRLAPEAQRRITLELDRYADRLESLRDAVANQRSLGASPRSDPLSRLIQEWEEFLESGGLASLNSELEKVDAPMRRRWALLNDVQYQIPQLLRRYALTSRTRIVNAQPLMDLIDRLQRLESEIHQYEQDPLRNLAPLGQETLSEELEELQRQLRTELRADVAEVRQHLAQRQRTWSIRSARIAQDLLATPLLDVDERIDLLQRIASVEPQSLDLLPVSRMELSPQRLSQTLSGEGWRRGNAVSRARLQQRLSDLLAADAATLPEAVGRMHALSPRERFRVATLVVDMGTEAFDGHCFATVSFPERPDPERLELAGLGGGERPIGLEWEPVEFRLIRSGTGEKEVRLQIDYDPQEIDLRRPPDESSDSAPLDPLAAQGITIDGNQERTFRFEARARPQTSSRLTTELRVSARSNTHSDQFSLRFRLPKPNRVQFLAEAVHAPLGLREGSNLRLYPNRDTAVRFDLVNESGWDREFRVDLIASPIPLTRSGSPGELADLKREVLTSSGLAASGDAGEIRPNVTVLATVPSVTVPPLGRVRLRFLDPAGIAPPSPSPSDVDAAPEKPAASPKEQDEGPVPLPHGLVYVLREIGSDLPMERIVEVRPIPTSHIPPRHFLEADVRYDLSAQRVVARVSARDVDGDGSPDVNQTLPVGWREPPMVVRLSNAGDFPAGSGQLSSQSFDPISAQATVFAELPPDGRRYRVELDVDGYPRAFVFTGTCSPTQPTTQAELRSGDLREIGIASLSVPGAPYRFLPTGARVRGVPVDPESKLPTMLAESAPFPGPIREPFLIRLRVDAPNDAFVNLNRSDNVLVKFGDLREVVFDSDRLERLSLTGIAEESGELSLRCDVTDLEHRFDVGQIENTDLVLSASLDVSQRTYHAEGVRVVVDSQPPQTKRTWLEPALNRYPADQHLTYFLEATDRSGVESVQIVLTHALTGEPVVPQRLNALPVTGVPDTWQVQLDPQAVKLQPGQSYRIVAHVKDRVGLEAVSEMLTFVTAVPPPAKEMKQPAPEPMGVVKGRIVKRGRPLEGARITVELVASGKEPQQVDRGGNFLFRDVPPGSYRLRATGSFKGISHSGEMEGVQPSPANKPQTVDLSLSDGP